MILNGNMYGLYVCLQIKWLFYVKNRLKFCKETLKRKKKTMWLPLMFFSFWIKWVMWGQVKISFWHQFSSYSVSFVIQSFHKGCFRLVQKVYRVEFVSRKSECFFFVLKQMRVMKSLLSKKLKRLLTVTSLNFDSHDAKTGPQIS